MLSYADNISDEEFVPPYHCYRSKNPHFGYQWNDVFDPENMNSADCKAEFRVEIKADFVALSEVRVSVEWLFGDIINFVRFLDYKKNLKIGLSCVGKMYLVCALLRNAITSNLFICCYMVIRRLSFSTWRRQL